MKDTGNQKKSADPYTMKLFNIMDRIDVDPNERISFGIIKLGDIRTLKK
jgi:hypothetical protein